MKRLKKKAWDSITLYHYTSTQYLMKMVDEGQITPGGYNDNVSGGGHYQIYDISDDKSEGTLFPLVLIDEFANNEGNKDREVTQDLINYLNKRKEENPDEWRKEETHVKIEKPSGNENGVYLTLDQQDAYQYRYSAIASNNDKSIPNFGVRLTIEVQTDALSPDYDDLTELEVELDKDSKQPLWKQSLDKINQCLHNGPIDIGSVTAVEISDEVIDCGQKFEEKEQEFLEFTSNIVRLDTDISISEAIDSLKRLNEEYNNLSQDNLMTTSKNRLRGRLRK